MNEMVKLFSSKVLFPFDLQPMHSFVFVFGKDMSKTPLIADIRRIDIGCNLRVYVPRTTEMQKIGILSKYYIFCKRSVDQSSHFPPQVTIAHSQVCQVACNRTKN